MNGFLRQSTAAQARLIGPFVDETDFKTAETALTINNTDIKLRANGTTLSNKNSGGGTHQVNGMYSVAWDATDTANLGELFFSVVVSGALQVFGSYVVLPAQVYDSLVLGTDKLQVHTDEITAGLITSSTFAAGAINAAAIATDAIDNDALAANAVTEIAAGISIPTAGAIADAVWDEAISGHLTAGTTGKALSDAGSAGVPPTANAIAQEILKVDWTTISGEAARSVLNALRFLRNGYSISGSTLTIYNESGTAAYTLPLATTAGANPVTSVGP